MGVKIQGRFVAELGTEMQHLPSRVILRTEPPTDNGGKGDSFSPTDLLATAYGSCMMSIMALHAKKQTWDLTGMTIDIEKIMTSQLPRKVAKLIINLSLPPHLSEAQRQTLIGLGRNCPVALSVAPDLEIDFTAT